MMDIFVLPVLHLFVCVIWCGDMLPDVLGSDDDGRCEGGQC
jgi:hypothetical protein